MNKPTLFFSHSSKDRDMILTIKNKLMSATGGVLNIFMSSDGQSIPFGTNWIHKIEEGLNDARIMFVFVTENSLPSGWIYFEAGFAYNKGIKVIPVGIGVDIGALKAPLNLLQGFNITSGDSLNNFISIVNKEFSYSFRETFSAEDYDGVMSYATWSSKCMWFDSIVSSISCELGSRRIKDQPEECFNSIIGYLEKEGIPYSGQKNYPDFDEISIVVCGIRITYRDKNVENKISISISTYAFEDSFSLYCKLITLLDKDKECYLHIRVKDGYEYVKREEDCSAMIASEKDWFEFEKERIGIYACKKNSLRFGIFDYSEQNKPGDYALSIAFKAEKVTVKEIRTLFSKLYEIGLVNKKTEE